MNGGSLNAFEFSPLIHSIGRKTLISEEGSVAIHYLPFAIAVCHLWFRIGYGC